ncbi:MAG: hypothetical protein AAFW46_19680, partial [Pseudomonadota bacterium]
MLALDLVEERDRGLETAFSQLVGGVVIKRLDGLLDVFETAVALFDEVERQHPYSAWARKAML